MEKKQRFEIAKADPGIGVIFGWACVSKVDGADYEDSQGDVITEAAILKASAEFMEMSRAGKVAHNGPVAGKIVFALPLTEDIAKALDITCRKSGLVIGFKPTDPAVLDKFAKGEYAGFSVGGWVKESRMG